MLHAYSNRKHLIHLVNIKFTPMLHIALKPKTTSSVSHANLGCSTFSSAFRSGVGLSSHVRSSLNASVTIIGSITTTPCNCVAGGKYYQHTSSAYPTFGMQHHFPLAPMRFLVSCRYEIENAIRRRFLSKF